ncbi:class I SAM-dependent methyltransferase [Amycolatopsis palatopharyngis]|uniref:class I SAM-dependent methyltransferase n=1 Tax=Amycolatopsis palatopharyngis TaxID=187982 RepID=UPI000E254538|nr:class I SAM-dependent methyltransferase [Amycolatopsis palatopharyngis]
MTGHSERLARLAQGWDEAAKGYEAYYVPRFAPWVDAAVRAITARPLPDGPVLVPCCGTLPELDALSEHLPDREIIGIDLSRGMVRRARERATRYPRVSVVEGDASTPAAHGLGRSAAVVSVFGLQQLPEPDMAIQAWARNLRPTGRLSVLFWPRSIEADGPFARLSEVVRRHEPSSGDSSWEDRLVPSLAALGTVIERDEQLSFPMSHPDAATFFDAHTRSGPLRPLADQRGDAFVSRLRAEFLRESPAGEWHHRPSARHIVARG